MSRQLTQADLLHPCKECKVQMRPISIYPLPQSEWYCETDNISEHMDYEVSKYFKMQERPNAGPVNRG